MNSGLLARFWKAILAGGVAVLAGIRRLFRGRDHIADPPSQA